MEDSGLREAAERAVGEESETEKAADRWDGEL
jgi:hypothetical protein